MNREEFNKFLKLIQGLGLEGYHSNGIVRFINKSHVYMIVDSHPDYLDGENINVMADKGIIANSLALKEPDLKVKESSFSELLLTFDHLSRYKKRGKDWVRFIIGSMENQIVIGNVDSGDEMDSESTKAEVLGKTDSSNALTAFDGNITGEVLSFLDFFKYSGISSGFITLTFREGMPMIIEKGRFKIYVAPMNTDLSDRMMIMKKIRKAISYTPNISQFETEE